jgi:Tol biopolymer transport system component
MTADGSERTLLADDLGIVGDLAWSKDGSRLAVISGVACGESGGHYYTEHYEHLWVMNADGSDARLVALKIPAYRGASGSNPYNFAECDWSPDGGRLAITASYIDDTAAYGESFTLLLVDVSSGEVREVGGSSEDLYWGTVSWHPDGSEIVVSAHSEDNAWFLAFDSDSGGYADVSLTTPDLTEEQRQTTPNGEDRGRQGAEDAP